MMSALNDKYYGTLHKNLESDRTTLVNNIESMKLEVEKIDHQFRRYRSSKYSGAEEHKDNVLKRSKLYWSEWIERGRKVLNKMTLVKWTIDSKKARIIKERLESEDKLLKAALNDRKKSCKEHLTELNEKLRDISETSKSTKEKLETKDNSIFGKMKGTFYNVKSSYYGNQISKLKGDIKKEEKQIEYLNSIKNIRTSDIYEDLKREAELEDKAKFSLIFNSPANFIILDNKIKILDEKYSNILEEFKEEKLITQKDIISLDGSTIMVNGKSASISHYSSTPEIDRQ